MQSLLKAMCPPVISVTTDGHGYLVYWSWLSCLMVMAILFNGHGYLVYWSWLSCLMVMAILFIGFLALNDFFNYLTFQSFDFECT
jgi:hypothetical protein